MRIKDIQVYEKNQKRVTAEEIKELQSRCKNASNRFENFKIEIWKYVYDTIQQETTGLMDNNNIRLNNKQIEKFIDKWADDICKKLFNLIKKDMDSFEKKMKSINGIFVNMKRFSPIIEVIDIIDIPSIPAKGIILGIVKNILDVYEKTYPALAFSSSRMRAEMSKNKLIQNLGDINIYTGHGSNLDTFSRIIK